MEQQNRQPDKLTDKAFSRLMITSVVGILLCIVFLCSASWAWFNAETSNNNNLLKSGNFDLVVTVRDESFTALDTVANSDGTVTCIFASPAVYNVTLKISDDTTVTKGFCIIKVGAESYKTSSINVDGDNPITITLNVLEPDLSVIFVPTWGIPSSFDVTPDTSLDIGIAPIEIPEDSEEDIPIDSPNLEDETPDESLEEELPPTENTEDALLPDEE